MKPANKKIANLIFALAASLAAAGSITKVDPAVDLQYEVFGPSKVEAGSLVLLNVQGEDVRWEVFPQVPIETYGDNNAFLATAFKDAGDYLVVCAFKDSEGKVRIEKQLIVSTNEQIVEPEPEPTPPIVEPETVTTKFPEVQAQVADVASKSNLSKETAREIGTNFGIVAERIASGSYSNSSEILRDTAALNRPLIKVGAVTTQIQLIVSKKRFDGEIVELEDYQDLWTQISEGLIGYANR